MKIPSQFLNVNCNLTKKNLFFPVMTPEEAKRTQRPYRYGMLLLCFGALINWIGLAENYTEPIRYAGVACILSGAMLICTAMCCWLRSPGPEPVTRSFEVNIFMLLVTWVCLFLYIVIDSSSLLKQILQTIFSYDIPSKCYVENDGMSVA